MDPTGHTPTDGGDPLADVDTYTGLHEAQEHALVILAMNQPCWVVESMPGGGYVLRADPDALPGIRREIDAYDAEQRRTVPIRDASAEPTLYPAAGWVALVWSIVLAAVFLWQQVDPKLVRFAASSSIELIDHDEWWRPFTALFLHADVAHLVGNLFGGALFGVLASRLLGAVRAWPLILLSGAVGNACTSWLTHPAEFSSIGASTAVFAALGLLSGSGFVSLMRIDVKLSLLRLTAPVIGGIALLGWMGGSSPGSNTDVLGHVTGFVFGLVGGVLCGWVPRGSNARCVAG
jgi:membrane associated rhomboid family serine protease